MKFFVLGNAEREGVMEEANRLLPFLQQHGEVLGVDFHQSKDLQSLPNADIAIVLGGDGAILRAARQMGYHQTPVLGVNLGRLGFLADMQPDELRACFPNLTKGDFRVTNHLMYECIIESSEGDHTATHLGLNEVVVHTTPPFPILDLEMKIDGDHVARFSGDGLIISTPIGSTAHSLSAGGPILGQELQAFVVTPICPHTLTYRPVVDTAEKTYTISLGEDSEEAMVIVDGQEQYRITKHHQVTVRKAPVNFALVKVPGHTFFQTLRDKLRWGAPPNYRREPKNN